VAVIARILMVQLTDRDHPSAAEPQFKHAMITVATEAAVLTPHCPALALVIFTELLNEIARVRYYPPKTPRPSPPAHLAMIVDFTPESKLAENS
jgi:hypothetical protein